MSRAGVAIIGGGINGLCSAWALAEAGYKVTVFERDLIMGATSSASSKLLHGGLRYLETGEFRLVHEALIERKWWIDNCPQIAHRLQLALPVYNGRSRSALLIGAGLTIYSLLAGRRGIGGWRWSGPNAFARTNPQLSVDGLRGGFNFFDGQMNDNKLGIWVADTARSLGVDIREQCEVSALGIDGSVHAKGQRFQFDAVVNCAGPWASILLEQSSLTPSVDIRWVRGSHIFLNDPCEAAYMLQVPGESRIFFVLPYEGRTMIGTTEVPQSADEPIAISEQEASYLLSARNAFFRDQRRESDITGSFAGVRPLLAFKGSATAASREYVIERNQRLLTVYGGKWTTARALGHKVRDNLKNSGLLTAR